MNGINVSEVNASPAGVKEERWSRAEGFSFTLWACDSHTVKLRAGETPDTACVREREGCRPIIAHDGLDDLHLLLKDPQPHQTSDGY